MKSDRVAIDSLKGVTIIAVDKNPVDVLLTLRASDGAEYKFLHEQDCCESVWLDQIDGDTEDLIGAPLVMAEEVSSEPPPAQDPNRDERSEWTFYKLATAKGYVTLRFGGSSNGYYSTDVSLFKVT